MDTSVSDLTANTTAAADTTTITTGNTNHFPLLHVLEPLAGYVHTHTAIMIHGQGSSGPEFAENLFSSLLSGRGGDEESLRSRFPSCRWVFPSSPSLWSTTFEEDMPAWFEARSLSDICARQDLQIQGIRRSTGFLIGILDQEVERLWGARENLFLCGISQGGAIALWTLFCQRSPMRNLGAFVGVSCWLPFAEAIWQYFGDMRNLEDKSSAELSHEGEEAVLTFLESMTADDKITLPQRGSADPLLSTPVFLGHGTDDAYIDIALGRQVRDILRQIGLTVSWNEYTGADQEGHWFKEPEGLDDVGQFLAEAIGKTARPAG